MTTVDPPSTRSTDSPTPDSLATDSLATDSLTATGTPGDERNMKVTEPIDIYIANTGGPQGGSMEPKPMNKCMGWVRRK